MLINFSIQNFGSIKDKQTLSFEADKSKHLEDYYVIETNGLRLLKLGLIYGANASGKTTVLKALDFLRETILVPKRAKTETLLYQPFLFDKETPNKNSIFSIDFLHNDIRHFYEIELNQKSVVREELYCYNPNKSIIFKRKTDLEIQYSEIRFGNKIKINKNIERLLEFNTLWNESVVCGFLKSNVELPELKNAVDWFSAQLPLIYSPKQFLQNVGTRYNTPFWKEEQIELIPILKKADMNISNIIYDETERNLKFEHIINFDKYLLDFEEESEGTQRYYEIAYILHYLLKKRFVCLIDELESSLHPDLFQHFLLSFLVNSKHSQLIATMHNREILNNKDIFRNDAIWITDKSNAECASELYSLADFDTSVIRDTSNIYNAYKLGKLGGVPNLGDYYIETEEEK